jgi:hypothetical protein
VAIKFKHKVAKKHSQRMLIKFINNTLILKEDIQTNMLRKFKVQVDEGEKKTKKSCMGYFSAINPNEDLKEKLSKMKPDEVITIDGEGSETFKSYGFTKFAMSAAF